MSVKCEAISRKDHDISRAMGCSNKNLERSLINFLKVLNINYLKLLKKDIDDSINFINPARSKNSLVKFQIIMLLK